MDNTQDTTAVVDVNEADKIAPAGTEAPVEALSFSVKLEKGDALPSEVHLLPMSAEVTGRDGRLWKNNIAGIMANFKQVQTDLPIDVEHATELKAPKGETAPAIGWISALFVKDSAENAGLYGHVSWTDAGADFVRSRAYRYLSPAFVCDENKSIKALLSVALTNRPNIALKSLNSAQIAGEHAVEANEIAVPQPFLERLSVALNAQETLGETEAISHIEAERNNQKIVLERALNRAETAEIALNALKATQETQAIDAMVHRGIQAGKIPPASQAFYVQLCQSEAGREAFERFLIEAPVVLNASRINANLAQQPKPSSSILSQVAKQFGHDSEALKQAEALLGADTTQ